MNEIARRPVRQGRVVDMAFSLEVARPVAAVWRIVADLPRFGCYDPFHRRIIVMGPRLERGVDLAIEHRFAGVAFWRFGRVLRWREGESLAFSDISAGGERTGFPHVFFVKVGAHPQCAAHTLLAIRVRGRWTARWIPHPLAWLWLRFICVWHARLLKRAFGQSL